MKEKKWVANIYLDRGKAVKNRRDRSIVSDDPVALAKHYNDNGADELLLFDLSDTDAEHDAAISLIKQIVEVSEIPVTGCGNIKRFEDVKKILYTGCSKAALNYAKHSNIQLTEEVSKRFGADRIAACVDAKDEIEKNKELLEKMVCELIFVNSEDRYDSASIKALKDICSLSLLIPMPDGAPGQIADILKDDHLIGMHGPLVNANIRELNSIKAFCAECGITVNGFDAQLKFSDLTPGADGLVPVVVQDYQTKEVLMVAYMNEAAFDATIKTGRMTYYSRSRKAQWVKGETSGHFQYVKELSADCDKDTLLAKVSQVGAACHTGNYSCFFNEIIHKDYIDTDPTKVFQSVYDVIMDRKAHPKEGSYTNYLFDKGIDKILKKVGEECTEIVIAAKNPDPEEIKYEISDFLYHVMVLMAERGVTWEDITRELARR